MTGIWKQWSQNKRKVGRGKIFSGASISYAAASAGNISSPTLNVREGNISPHTLNHCGGMTLIEILVALAIFTISFLVLIDAQNLNIRNSAHAHRMTIATVLAQDKLTETVLKYKNKITEIGEKEEGSFEGNYSKYRWEMTSRDFAYDLSFLAAMAGENQQEQPEGSPLAGYLPKVSQFIKNSSKEITVTVFWKEGAGERNVSITTHLFNYKAPLPI